MYSCYHKIELNNSYRYNEELNALSKSLSEQEEKRNE